MFFSSYFKTVHVHIDRTEQLAVNHRWRHLFWMKRLTHCRQWGRQWDVQVLVSVDISITKDKITDSEAMHFLTTESGRNVVAYGWKTTLLRPVKPWSRGPRHTFECRPYCFLWQRLFCAAPGRHLCTKIAAAPRITIRSRDHAHAQRHAWEMLLWLKNGAPRTSCTACSSKKTIGCQKLLRRFAQGFAGGLQVGRESLLLCIGNTCELDNWDVHATVLHGDGVEFRGIRASAPSQCMYVSEWRPYLPTFGKLKSGHLRSDMI